MTAITLSEAQRPAFVAQVIRICQLVPTVVALYDHLITLDREVELVWNKPWTFAKVLFLWNRYLSSLFLLASALLFFAKPSSDEFCRDWFIVQGWCMAVLIWSMQSVMLFRTFAIYQQRQNIIIACLLFYVAQIASTSVILAASQPVLDARREFFPGAFICTPQHVPDYYRAVWIPAIAFDCGLCALSLWACLRHARHLRGVLTARSQMWDVLLTDTFLYFSVTLTTSIANSVVWFIFSPEWLRLLQGFHIAATCVMGVRMVLSLRRAYYVYSPGDLGSSDFTSRTVHGHHIIPLREIRLNVDAERRNPQSLELPSNLTPLERTISLR